MLSLSKKTDYALLALSHLARAYDGRAVNNKEIAEQYGIPVELLAKIMQRLSRARLVVSAPGPSGGYRLARTPGDISVGAIVEVIDGPTAIVHCMKPTHNACVQLDRCTVRTPLARINVRIAEMLKLISLAEISGADEQPHHPGPQPLVLRDGPPGASSAATT